MHVRRLFVIGVGALLTAGWATAASAAPAAHSVAPTSHASVRPASNCGWQPANDSNAPTSFTGDGVNLRTGPGADCTSLGLGYTSHGVVIRCVDLADGYDYVTDNSTGVTGWAADQYIGDYYNVLQC